MRGSRTDEEKAVRLNLVNDWEIIPNYDYQSRTLLSRNKSQSVTYMLVGDVQVPIFSDDYTITKQLYDPNGKSLGIKTFNTSYSSYHNFEQDKEESTKARFVIKKDGFVSLWKDF